MTGYDKLVAALRSASTVSTAFGKSMADAADAIEALQAEIRESMQRCAECGDELAHQMPKRGEIVRCGECKYYLKSSDECGIIETTLQFYAERKRWTEDSFCSWGEQEVQDADT